MDFWKEFIINNAIGIILSTVKNPDSQAKFKRAFLKIFVNIGTTYIADPDFQTAINSLKTAP